MKTLYLCSALTVGILVAVACGPSQPANTADDGATSTTTATATADMDGAGGDTGAGGATATATATATASAMPSVTATATASAAPQTRMQMVGAGDVANGQKVFEANNCTGCHGTPKAPGKKAPNLYKLTWDDKHVDEAFEIVAKGKKPMPAYGDKLKDKDIADVVAYLKANPAK